MSKQGQSHRCSPSLQVIYPSFEVFSVTPKSWSKDTPRSESGLGVGDFKESLMELVGDFWALRDPEGSGYLSEGHLPWPVWREEAQTPLRRANRYASEAACVDSREGLLRTAAPPGALGTGKAPGRDNKVSGQR